MSVQSLEQNLGFFKQLHFLEAKMCFLVWAVRYCTVVAPSCEFFNTAFKDPNLRAKAAVNKQLLSTAVPHMGLHEEKNILFVLKKERFISEESYDQLAVLVLCHKELIYLHLHPGGSPWSATGFQPLCSSCWQERPKPQPLKTSHLCFRACLSDHKLCTQNTILNHVHHSTGK